MSLPFPTLTPQEAAALVNDGDTIGFSGFTPAGAAKVIPTAIADSRLCGTRKRRCAPLPSGKGVVWGINDFAFV